MHDARLAANDTKDALQWRSLLRWRDTTCQEILEDLFSKDPEFYRGHHLITFADEDFIFGKYVYRGHSRGNLQFELMATPVGLFYRIDEVD